MLDRIVPVDEGLTSAMRSVVKIYVTTVEPDYSQPWQVFMEEECTGSGFAIALDGEENARALVTNAHVVQNAVEIRVRKAGEVHKYKAKALLVAHTADLALLSVDDERFWDDVPALEWASLPRLYENVKVAGYPMGGDNACVTRGVVSRIDTTSYVRGAEQLLVVQIDAAINSGNSGGPVLDDNANVVGVAFSGYAGSADNIGYIIPRSVVENVLVDYASASLDARESQRVEAAATKAKLAHKKKKKNGKSASKSAADDDDCGPLLPWRGLCDLGVSWQYCESPTLRRKLKVADGQTGVLITRVAPLCCGAAAGVLAGDVLLTLGGVTVANDGSVLLRGSERVAAESHVTSRRAGDKLALGVLRDGKRVELECTLAPVSRLVPLIDGFDASPSYVIVAGLVFMALSAPLVAAFHAGDDEEGDDELVFSAEKRFPDLAVSPGASPDDQVVVWTQTLSHDVNFGYSCPGFPTRLDKVDGVKVRSLAHLIVLTREDTSKPFVEMELSPPHDTAPAFVVVDRAQAKSAESALLRRSKCPASYSPDLEPATCPPRRRF